MDHELISRANKKIEETSLLVSKDYHRLVYHIMPPVGLLNDPNGFIHYENTYHLFYQFHPFGVTHGLKFWGHVKSQDLVHWEEQPIALAPDKWYDKNGCYSGSAISYNDKLVLIYTGNVKDELGNRSTYQCYASSEDTVRFYKDPTNPIITNQPDGYTRHFRDPKVWKVRNTWYMIIGTQTEDKEGRAVLYKSTDFIEWHFVGEVTGSNLNGVKDLGYMFECPDLFEINGREVLIFCPQGMKEQGILYQNIYQAGYVVGTMNYETGLLTHGEFIELDRGFEFYAPQTCLDEFGRRILVAWMGLPELEEHPTIKYGWIHTLTLPRLLELKEDRLIQKPIPELKQLRINEIAYRQIKLAGEKKFVGINGDVFELYVLLESIECTEFGIGLRASINRDEVTLITYESNKKLFTLNREFSGEGYKGTRSCFIDKLKEIHVFSDTSSIEIFVNGGLEVFSARIYPKESSQEIYFYTINGTVDIKELFKWNLRSDLNGKNR